MLHAWVDSDGCRAAVRGAIDVYDDEGCRCCLYCRRDLGDGIGDSLRDRCLNRRSCNGDDWRVGAGTSLNVDNRVGLCWLCATKMEETIDEGDRVCCCRDG